MNQLLQPRAIRFFYDFIALKSLLTNNTWLKSLFASEEQCRSSYSTSQEGREMEHIILNSCFLDNMSGYMYDDGASIYSSRES